MESKELQPRWTESKRCNNWVSTPRDPNNPTFFFLQNILVCFVQRPTKKNTHTIQAISLVFFLGIENVMLFVFKKHSTL